MPYICNRESDGEFRSITDIENVFENCEKVLLSNIRALKRLFDYCSD